MAFLLFCDLYARLPIRHTAEKLFCRKLIELLSNLTDDKMESQESHYLVVDMSNIQEKVNNLLHDAYNIVSSLLMHLYSESYCTFKQDDEAYSQLHSNLTSLLFCARNVTSSSAELELDEIKKQGPRQVCQYQFKKNDIVWICRSCQSDETCVLCNDCFQDSVHKGHEVYFYHSQAGGCCDCGDAGAWKPEGFCTRHGRSHPNPISTVPDDVKNCGKAVIDAVIQKNVNFCEECARSYDVDNVIGEDGVMYNVFVHNDDIHTSVEISDALAKVISIFSVQMYLLMIESNRSRTSYCPRLLEISCTLKVVCASEDPRLWRACVSWQGPCRGYPSRQVLFLWADQED
jgi:hypothetical protein